MTRAPPRQLICEGVKTPRLPLSLSWGVRRKGKRWSQAARRLTRQKLLLSRRLVLVGTQSFSWLFSMRSQYLSTSETSGLRNHRQPTYCYPLHLGFVSVYGHSKTLVAESTEFQICRSLGFFSLRLPSFQVTSSGAAVGVVSAWLLYMLFAGSLGFKRNYRSTAVGLLGYQSISPFPVFWPPYFCRQ